MIPSKISRSVGVWAHDGHHFRVSDPAHFKLTRRRCRDPAALLTRLKRFFDPPNFHGAGKYDR